MKGFDAVLGRLKQSMKYCSGDEVFISEPSVYSAFSEFFPVAVTLSVGGQAGIAAVHLHTLGVPSVTCAVPGPALTPVLFCRTPVSSPSHSDPRTGEPADSIHLIFEYPPGLVKVAEGVVSRSNRFIVSRSMIHRQ